MSHNVFGRKLSRDTGARQALLRGLAGALIRSEAIETTEAKAKASIDLIEKIITQAKRASVNDLRLIETVIPSKELIDKLVHTIAPRFKTRPGGYLRLIKLGTRLGDNAPMVRMEFTESSMPAEVVATPKVVKASKSVSAPKSPKTSKTAQKTSQKATKKAK